MGISTPLLCNELKYITTFATILQWSKNDFKSMVYTNGDYSKLEIFLRSCD